MPHANSINFDRGEGVDSKYAITWNNIGVINYNKGEYEEAISAYKEAVELYPKYKTAWNNLGLAYKKVLELDPSDGVYWSNLGEVYLRKNDLPNARKMVNKGLELNPENFTVLYNHALISFNEKNLDDSLHTCDICLKRKNLTHSNITRFSELRQRIINQESSLTKRDSIIQKLEKIAIEFLHYKGLPGDQPKIFYLMALFSPPINITSVREGDFSDYNLFDVYLKKFLQIREDITISELQDLKDYTLSVIESGLGVSILLLGANNALELYSLRKRLVLALYHEIFGHYNLNDFISRIIESFNVEQKKILFIFLNVFKRWERPIILKQDYTNFDSFSEELKKNFNFKITIDELIYVLIRSSLFIEYDGFVEAFAFVDGILLDEILTNVLKPALEEHFKNGKIIQILQFRIENGDFPKEIDAIKLWDFEWGELANLMSYIPLSKEDLKKEADEQRVRKIQEFSKEIITKIEEPSFLEILELCYAHDDASKILHFLLERNAIKEFLLLPKKEGDVEIVPKKIKKCIVCMKIIKNIQYKCSECGVRYCLRCAHTLKDDGKDCFTCNAPFSSLPMLIDDKDKGPLITSIEDIFIDLDALLQLDELTHKDNADKFTLLEKNLKDELTHKISPDFFSMFKGQIESFFQNVMSANADNLKELIYAQKTMKNEIMNGLVGIKSDTELIKSDIELIKEYTSQIELILDNQDEIEAFLKEKLKSDWEKVKDIWHESKEGAISKTVAIKKSIKILGKKFIKKVMGK